MLPLPLFLAISIVAEALALTSNTPRDFHFKYSTDILGVFRQEKDTGNSPDPADYVRPSPLSVAPFLIN